MAPFLPAAARTSCFTLTKINPYSYKLGSREQLNGFDNSSKSGSQCTDIWWRWTKAVESVTQIFVVIRVWIYFTTAVALQSIVSRAGSRYLRVRHWRCFHQQSSVRSGFGESFSYIFHTSFRLKNTNNGLRIIDLDFTSNFIESVNKICKFYALHSFNTCRGFFVRPHIHGICVLDLSGVPINFDLFFDVVVFRFIFLPQFFCLWHFFYYDVNRLLTSGTRLHIYSQSKLCTNT